MGRIITVSDGAGRSVTVSNWGVAQTSRHLFYLYENNLITRSNNYIFVSVSDHVYGVMLSFNACNVTVRDRGEGVGKGREI
jgi:hypothetical protein